MTKSVSLDSLARQKYHPSTNTLISTEQRGGVRNKYIYICIYVSRFPLNYEKECLARFARSPTNVSLPCEDELLLCRRFGPKEY